MRTFGLIGNPLSQSFSQKYFTEKFKIENFDARFLNFELQNIDELPAMLEHHPYIAGLSVTIPYKEKIFRYLNELDKSAEAIGAVNCIKLTWNDKTPILKGYNTDSIGFTNSIKPLLKNNHTKALILGTGGAAKGVAYAFQLLGISYRFVSRNPKGTNHVSYAELTKEIFEEYTIIINSTPIGMYPNINECPDIPYHFASQYHLFYDLTYNPANTLFMLKGAEYGALVKNGLDMLHMQAEAAWCIWNE